MFFFAEWDDMAELDQTEPFKSKKLNTEWFNEVMQIKESFELPEKLMQILLDPERRNELFEKFEYSMDLSTDWFNEYFQESHSNREKMKQDFTPHELAALLPQMTDSYKCVADICSGTGGLTIAAWNKQPDAYYYCAELSNRAFPLLLFNLAIRNIKGVAVNTDILTGEVFAAFTLTPGKKFSNIKAAESTESDRKFDFVIMNPPYSLKHQWKTTEADSRFNEYPYPPSAFSDYAFVIHGLSIMEKGGTLCAILPHGVLFRGRQEEEIRQKLIERQMLKTVIGLPDELFLNTTIPVCVMVLHHSPDVLIVDASKCFTKAGGQKQLERKHLEKIITTVKLRENVCRLSHIADVEEIISNDFNLNISRYVDTYEPPSKIDILGVVRDYCETDRQIRKAEADLMDMLLQMEAAGEEKVELNKIIEAWKGMCNGFI